MLKSFIVIYTMLFSLVIMAEDTAVLPLAAAEKTSVAVSSSQISREYVIYPASSFDYILNQVFSPNSGSSRDDKGFSISLKASRNFGNFEVGPSVFTNYSETGTSANSSKARGYGLFLQYNFFKNEVGQKVIPFVSAEITTGEQSVTITSVETVTSYTRTYLTAGVECFPVNDYLSIALGLVSSQRKYDIQNNSNDYQFTSLNLSGDLKIYF